MAIPAFGYGGAERYAVRVAAAAAQGWDVAAAVRDTSATIGLRRDLSAHGVRTLLMARGQRARGVVGFLAMLKLFNPEAVLVALAWPLAAPEVRAACAVLAVPTVLVHQLVPEPEHLAIKHPRFYSWTRRRHQTWVAVSKYGRHSLQRAFLIHDPDEIKMIYNAPSPLEIGTDGDPRDRIGVAPDDVVLVAVGRLNRAKGHDVLLDATAQLAGEHPRVRVLIAGEGEERDALERQIRRLGLVGKVRLLGEIDRPADLLRAADVFVMPSRVEGTPFALLEAMSCALPVVATSFAGVDEIIDSGRDGVIVALDDVGGLATAINALLRDQRARRELGERARAAVDGFSETKMLNETTALLTTVTRRVRDPDANG